MSLILSPPPQKKTVRITAFVQTPKHQFAAFYWTCRQKRTSPRSVFGVRDVTKFYVFTTTTTTPIPAFANVMRSQSCHVLFLSRHGCKSRGTVAAESISHLTTGVPLRTELVYTTFCVVLRHNKQILCIMQFRLFYITNCLCIIMVALWNRADHYIFILWFLYIFYLFFLA